MTGDVEAIVTSVGRGVVILMAAWAVFRFCKAVAETIIALPSVHRDSVDASLYRLSARLLGILFGAWIVIDGIHSLGVDILPLLAGLSVSGLAFALAARPMLENIIGSFMIFADKPYRVGHRIMVMQQTGIVESIGLRSTRIRLRSGNLLTIPNEKMASMEVENVGERPHIRRVFDIRLSYDTSPEKVQRAVSIVRDILAVPASGGDASSDQGIVSAIATGDSVQDVHPNVAINQPDFGPRVFFNNFNEDSLNIVVMYWFHPPKKSMYLEHANGINVQIIERFKAADIEFALPAQTLHLASDDKRPLTVSYREESTDHESTDTPRNSVLGADQQPT
jgi:MscS family membrane protein